MTTDKFLSLKEPGLYSEAITSYGKAIVINPYNIDAKQNREIALQKLTRPSALVCTQWVIKNYGNEEDSNDVQCNYT